MGTRLRCATARAALAAARLGAQTADAAADAAARKGALATAPKLAGWCARAQRSFSASARPSAALLAASPSLKDAHSTDVVEDIYRCSFQRQTGVSLKYMMNFGKNPTTENLVVSAQFLQNELPVRLAHRVTELENLPMGLSDKAPIIKVRDWYVESFRELRAMAPVRTAADEAAFSQDIERILQRHANVVPMVALGVAELKEELMAGSSRIPAATKFSSDSWSNLPEIHMFLDGFYMSRIGLRMLIGQHVALHKAHVTSASAPSNFTPEEDDWVGLICTKVNPVAVAEEAIEDARAVCLRHYGCAPEVQVFADSDLRLPYVPGHLHQCLFELIKNSLRAVTDRYMDADEDPPPVRLVVADGDEDVTFKVSDEGGGIARSDIGRIWTYLYTTADTAALAMLAEDAEAGQSGAVVQRSPVLAGYGYGLPLSRLYARYFGGDLQVISMEGYGTDAYLHVHRLGEAPEPLP